MAGPGTGKSYGMKRRLLRLLEEDVPPKRILVVTFTRTAAAALVEDIERLGVEGCGDIWAGTLHAYCYGVLAKRYVLAFTRRVPRPLVTFSELGILQFEAAPLLHDVEQDEAFGDKRERTQRLRAYEADWARLQSDTPGSPQDPIDVRFRDELLKWLRFHEAMLIGEVVPLTLHYLRNNPACVERSAFDHVLVDEYQDLNKAEQVLLDHLAERSQYDVFGDEDQSIYCFRWAHPEGITEFHQDRPATMDCRLDECQRCPTRVVVMADSLIRHNHPAGGPTRLNPKAGKPNGEVHIIQWDHLGDESAGLTQFVRHLIDSRGYQAQDVLILSPRRLIGYGIRDALLGASVPTHSFYHEEALESDEARRAFAMLTLLANPGDRVALRYWVGEGSPTWNARGYKLLRSHCEASGLSPWEALEAVRVGTLRLPHTGPLVARFKDLMARLSELQSLKVPDLIDALFPEQAGWAKELRDLAMAGGTSDLNAPALLDRLRRGITQPEMPGAGEYARVMSLHKSKGLTSKVVIVTGCMQGLIPNVRFGGTHNELEAHEREQRRLFYVAVTRCTDILVLSCVNRLDRRLAYRLGVQVFGEHGQFAAAVASSFLEELGPTAPARQRGVDLLRGLPIA
jgi:superfamily I DNA/RNA helicase